jgi:hypothetical protein
MNCPHHIKIFASDHHSYRDLPVRLAEFGTVYRWEQSGELGGMTRVRGFTQDDAHLFCTPDQVAAEVTGCLDLVKTVLSTLGMHDYRVRLSLRDPDSDKYVGSPENWDKAEAALREAVQTLGVEYTEEIGEAAFYGPKIDFVVKDVIGRDWQLGTVQVDYNLPVRFGLSYVGADNQPHIPVMIHRAPFGSMERFTGLLIEHFEGKFPTWLAPEQVRILPISEKTLDTPKPPPPTRRPGVRLTVDRSSDKIGAKIRNARLDRVPYMLVIGQREADEGTVSVRHRDKDDLGAKPLDEFIAEITTEIKSRSLFSRSWVWKLSTSYPWTNCSRCRMACSIWSSEIKLGIGDLLEQLPHKLIGAASLHFTLLRLRRMIELNHLLWAEGSRIFELFPQNRHRPFDIRPLDSGLSLRGRRRDAAGRMIRAITEMLMLPRFRFARLWIAGAGGRRKHGPINPRQPLPERVAAYCHGQATAGAWFPCSHRARAEAAT